MISELELTGWRAYDHVKVPLRPGTTFVVARNGIGKTSLLQGAAFALFGELTPYGVPSAIRSGHSHAVAAVTVRLSDTQALSITRTLTPRKTETKATLDGKTLPPDEIAAHIAGAFGSSAEDLARLSILPAGTLHDYDTEKFHLHRHLCRLFGVDQLQAVQADLKHMLKAVNSQVRKLGESRRSSAAERSAWNDELQLINAQLETANVRTTQLRDEFAELSAVIDAADEAERYFEARDARDAVIASLRGKLTEIVSPTSGGLAIDIPSDSDLPTLVDALDESTTTRLAELQRERGRLEGRIEVLESTRSQLEDAEADCPVCRRPLDPGSRDAAIAAHGHDVGQLRAQVDVLNAELDALNRQHRGIQEVSRTLNNLTPLSARPPATDVTAVARARNRQAELLQERETTDETIAGLRVRAAELERRIDDDVEQQRQHAEAVLVYRREVLVNATSKAVDEMITRLITEKINPLQEMVAARWKTVFRGSRPLLQLGASGELKLVRDNIEIAFPDMSAGERAVALLVTRLLVLSVAAPNSFLWLDEPLEQLDPSNRRLLAQLIASTATGGAVRQLVVTTFEEELARRLEKSFDGVHLEYVTAAD